MKKYVRSPSKFLSLDFLVKLQSSYYVTDSGLEYHASEVDALVWEKQNKLIDSFEGLAHRFEGRVKGLMDLELLEIAREVLSGDDIEHDAYLYTIKDWHELSQEMELRIFRNKVLG